MFVGHYAAAFALKGKERKASLGWLFIATQFVDILFFPFAVMGFEHLEFVEGFTEVNNFNMYFYPFTHGLLGTLLWSALFYLLFKYVIVKNGKVAWVMALAVLSHWFADLLVHTPDLPLIHGDPKLGLGLWNNKLGTFGLEALILILGLWYYLKQMKLTDSSSKWKSIGFVVFLVLINYLNMYVLPQNDDLIALTTSALLSYFLLAGIAWWVDKGRV